MARSTLRRVSKTNHMFIFHHRKNPHSRTRCIRADASLMLASGENHPRGPSDINSATVRADCTTSGRISRSRLWTSSIVDVIDMGCSSPGYDRRRLIFLQPRPTLIASRGGSGNQLQAVLNLDDKGKLHRYPGNRACGGQWWKAPHPNRWHPRRAMVIVLPIDTMRDRSIL